MELTEFTNEALMDIRVRPVEQSEEAQYLGSLAKIGETVWYVAIWCEQWVAQLNLSAAASQAERARSGHVPASRPRGMATLRPSAS